jgi:uncharacterized membrane protein
MAKAKQPKKRDLMHAIQKILIGAWIFLAVICCVLLTWMMT